MSQLNKLSCQGLLLGSLFYFLSFNFFDQPIANMFHHLPHNTPFHTLFHYITFIGDSKVSFGFIAISLSIALGVLFRKPDNKLANNLLFLALSMITGIFLESAMKYLLGRYRPELLFQEGLYGFHFFSHQFLMNSTPSGHATHISILATGFSWIWRRLTPYFVFLGALVCTSRLILEFHYLSDVVFGALLGILVTLWIGKIYHSTTVLTQNPTFTHK